MRDEGYILLWRRFFDHEYWTKRRKFSKAEAWIDMIAMASFRDREILVGRTRIQLERGELLASVRFLAKRWRWGRDVVHAFIKDAEKADEIAAKTRTPEGHTYVIVKYDEYQLPPDTKPDKDRTRTGQNRIKGIKKEESSPNGEPKKTAFEPTAQHLELAESLHVNADRELEKFLDHILVKAPKWKDLNAAFRNWLRRAAEYNGARPAEPDDEDVWIAKLSKELI